MKRTLRTPLLFMAATLLIQVAWVLAIPPFRGIDEFDHAYRAASVAEGYWSPEWTDVRGAHGSLIPVPRRMVREAQDVCAAYEYTGPANCRGTTEIGHGLILAASGAARYNPVFYWLIGTPASITTGTRALYLMRVMSALLCSLLVGLTAWVSEKWARTRWPFVALALSLTPVTLYGFTLPAPNGVEMAAALCLWASLLGLAPSRTRESNAAPFVVVATIAAVPLVGVRTLGPLWLSLILAVGLLLLGRETLARLAKTHKRLVILSSALITSTTIAAVMWSLHARSNSLKGMPFIPGDAWNRATTQLPLWFLQSIAAFPTRNEPAPVVVYACGAVAFLAFLAGAMVIASPRVRILLAGLCVLSLGLPYTLTVMTYHAAGTAWQGRYTLPLAFGVVLLAGYAWDCAPVRSRIVGPVLLSGWLCVTVAHAVSTVDVLKRELVGSPMAGDPRWLEAPPWIVLLMTLVGMSVMALASMGSTPTRGVGGDKEVPSLPVESRSPVSP